MLTSVNNFKCYLEQSVQNQYTHEPSSTIELPLDIFKVLFPYLEFREHIYLSMASHAFKNIGKEFNFLWKSIFSKMTGIDESLLPNEEFEGMYKSSLKVYYVSISMFNKNKDYNGSIIGDLYAEALHEKNFFIFESLTKELDQSPSFTQVEKTEYISLADCKLTASLSKCLSQILSQFLEENQIKDIKTIEIIFTHLNDLYKLERSPHTTNDDREYFCFSSQIHRVLKRAITTQDNHLVDLIVVSGSKNKLLLCYQLRGTLQLILNELIKSRQYLFLDFIFKENLHKVWPPGEISYWICTRFLEETVRLNETDNLKNIIQLIKKLNVSFYSKNLIEKCFIIAVNKLNFEMAECLFQCTKIPQSQIKCTLESAADSPDFPK